jgi:hypothetical protein
MVFLATGVEAVNESAKTGEIPRQDLIPARRRPSQARRTLRSAGATLRFNLAQLLAVAVILRGTVHDFDDLPFL